MDLKAGSGNGARGGAECAWDSLGSLRWGCLGRGSEWARRYIHCQPQADLEGTLSVARPTTLATPKVLTLRFCLCLGFPGWKGGGLQCVGGQMDTWDLSSATQAGRIASFLGAAEPQSHSRLPPHTNVPSSPAPVTWAHPALLGHVRSGPTFYILQAIWCW